MPDPIRVSLRRPLLVLGLVIVAMVLPAGQASAVGPGGWDHLGDGGSAGTPSLNGAVYALNSDRPGTLYVGGNFTAAGGVSGADRIASWNGSAWSAVSSPSSQIANGAVNAIAYDAASGHLFAGGTFINAGGNPNADFLAEWNGTQWTPFCNGASPPIPATVNALQIVGRTLYVAGDFGEAAGIPSAARLVACNLDTGAASSTVDSVAHAFSGTIYALTADSNGTLYAGGGFTDLGGNAAADNVAYLDASGVGWHSMGGAAKPGCLCSVDDFVRSLTAVGTDVYVGTDARDVAGIAQADHVVRWNGSAWSAVGANTAGTDGWFPESAFIYGMANDGTNVYATGSFQNANGDPTADFIASFDGSNWHAVGSNGAGNGPWSGSGLALAVLHRSSDGLPIQLYGGGNFTSAGGDSQARFAASHTIAPLLTVAPAGEGSGMVHAPEISCPGTCSAFFARGATVVLHAEPAAGTVFLGWAGACFGELDCQVTLNADTTVIPEFYVRPTCTNTTVNIPAGSPAVELPLSCSRPGGGKARYGSAGNGPSHGSAGRGSDPDGLTYKPFPGFVGTDTFPYVAVFDPGAPNYRALFSANQSLTINVYDATKPQISKLALSTTAFRAASSGASISATKIGTKVSFALSEPSSVRFSVKRTGKGPKPKGSFKVAGKKGANSFTFRGRIGGRKLTPGRYQLIAKATDRAKNTSLPKRVAFKIIP